MKKIVISIILTTLILGNQSCSSFKDFGDTNNNPAGISNPLFSALLARSIYLNPLFLNSGSNVRASLYCQYFSETQYTDVSLYSIPKIEFGDDYSGTIQDLTIIEKQCTSNNMKQIAKILKQTYFWFLTNQFGDIPYTEALNTSIPQPKYDSQETIYKGILTELKSAVGAMDDSKVDGDLVYGGDVASWKRLGNSVRMLIALQLSKKYSAAGEYASNEFGSALTDAGGSISNNSQNFTLNFPGANYKNVFYNLYNGRKDYGESKTLTDLLGSLGDIRQNSFGGATQDLSASNGLASSNVGVPYGLKRASAEAFTGANTNWARILNGSFRKENSPLIGISAAVVLLARAEAAERGWTSEDPVSLYKTGITASFQQWGVSVSDAYLNASTVSLMAKGDPGNLEKIVTQEYIASFPNGNFGWNLYRRTGFPNLTPAPDATNSSKLIPRRFTYGTSEFSSNEANVKAAIKILNGSEADTQDDKIWWDK